jgi:GNAT superfamily N-acetyltransferase
VIAVREGLRPEDFQPAVAAAARAFMEDPGAVHLFPDVHRRERLLPASLEPSLRFGQRYGVVHTLEGSPDGLAVWVPPPGRSSVTVLRMLRCGGLRLFFRYRPPELMRASKFTMEVKALHPESFRTPHWYLWLLGVAPERQGQGAGSALLQPILHRADAERVPCALETMTERNVRFYHKHGFEVAAVTTGDKGPRTWAMWREPNPEATDDGRGPE